MAAPLPFHEYANRRMRLAFMTLPRDIHLSGEGSAWFTPVDAVRKQRLEAGERFVSLGHYDYLSLSRHPHVLSAAHAAIDAHGVGAGASRLIGGERVIHGAFEAELSTFLGSEAALVMGAGYLVGLSLIPHLVGAHDLILMDELVHSSMIHGAKATRATVRTFRHNDMDHLAQLLDEQRGSHGACLILVDSLYSMDGDLADLPRLLELRDAFKAWLLVDEAHSIGVLGASGRGICEHYGIDASQVDILVGTLSKTFASMGGFICARRDVIDWLKFTLPGFVFSVGLSPVIMATAQAELDVLRREPDRVARLQALSRTFLTRAKAHGFCVGDAIGAGVIPILFDTPHATIAASRALAEAGIYAPPIMHMGIGSGKPRIRFFLSADLDPGLVEDVFAILKPSL